MTEASVVADKEKPSIKESIGGLFVLAYIVGIVAYSVWFLIDGGFHKPVTQLVSFFKKTYISPQVFSWEWDTIVGFILLNLWASIGAILLMIIATRRNPKLFFEKWKQMLSSKPLRLFYRLLAAVAAEEIVFRWFPLAILYPLWGTNIALWIIVALSSVIFGLLHVLNQKPGQRNIAFTLPQILCGFVFSYLFLAYGFEAVLAIHLLFDVLLLIALKIMWECNPEVFAEKSA